MIRLFAITLCVVLCLIPHIGKSADISEPLNINQNWLYLENNTTSPESALANTQWQPISLPHTWNAIDTVDSKPGYRRSASWYKRFLTAKDLNTDGLTHLYFEGANFETEVYVNGSKAGEHIGGYVGFTVDITAYLVAGQDAEILVRVSNQYNPNLIPSQKADFFLYGGITRDVWVTHLPKTYIQQAHVKTPQVSAEKAKAKVTVSVVSAAMQQANMKVSLVSPNGKLVSETALNTTLKAGTNEVPFALPEVLRPALWSPDSPSLYTVKVTLATEGGVKHSHVETIGFRWFEMRPHKGFFLNGERLLLRGTHRHEEHAGVGAAVSNEQHRKDMEMIKKLGANFVRLGHYPQDPEVYKAANELGLLIWDELPWCRGGKGGAEWEKNTEHMLKAMISQNMNHPSIVFWSMGNEMYWEEDFPGGGATEVVSPYLQKLHNMTKSLDPDRLTTIRKYYPGWDIVDAFSPSIWAGWYGGSYNQYETALKRAMGQYPAFLHMEYGGSSHVGRHTETPVSEKGLLDAQVSVEEAVNQAVVKSVAKDTDWNENYIVDLFDWHLNVSESLEGFAGNAQWAFKDFGTPLRPENPIPYMNMKGLVDRAGNPKDAYYVFASYWSKEPMCWVESHTWTHRNGPKEGLDVTVYCNTEQAELFHNGKSLGKLVKQQSAVPAGGLVWKVPFKPGENALRVLGFNDGKQVAEDEHKVQYVVGKFGKFDHIKLTAKQLDNNRFLIEAEARDKNGNRVLDYSERAYFFNIGDEGVLLENQGTPRNSSIIEMASGYAAIEFLAGTLPSTVEFRTQNIKGVYVQVPSIN